MAVPDRTEPVALVPRYYRDNFLQLCDAVEALYGDLLHADERALLARWRDLPEPAQCLYVRLVSRVGPWFRRSKLAYAEIGDLAAALTELSAAGLLATSGALGLEELARLFTVAEWRRAFAADLPAAQPRSKPDLLAAIAALQWPDADLLGRLLEVTGDQLVAPIAGDTVQLLQLLFFGNRRQGLTDFVLSDLGIARYYPYPLDRQRRRFSCREAVDEYRYWGELADAHWLLQDAGDAGGLAALAEQTLATSPRFATSERRYWKLCNRLARNLERIGELALAAQLYARSQLHPARERHIRVLENSGSCEQALQQCKQLLDQPWCEEEREAAQRILPRLHRRLGQPSPARRRDAVRTLDLALPRVEFGVELAVARHLAADWRGVHYVENALFNSLFGLAFWEQIFSPVAGAFHNAFQSVPADMYLQGFYQRRQTLLDARLAELATVDLYPELLTALHRYWGYQCRWVSWQLLSAPLLEQVLACLPREHLLAIWQRMLFDPGENRRGFPDLIALGDAPGAYCLIEVKGPGDQLQHSQRRWLRFFAEQAVPACVARVSWASA
ncbi:VRR-NUC domain-containing protein [Haliea sp. E1-2-M8]|uniref:VRR-NUC domain-containing protein n=1 Tax=Haliea sp. E1-2-M8 TaxID=3064706 RepID=UPI00272540B8|nr:VRR-NUC domain-containing protein [Haliea sp. E1-2-M8]MDO8860948.1 VRR-NUC domain-containing protein [Haliea sp. E1-2-M8]